MRFQDETIDTVVVHFQILCVSAVAHASLTYRKKDEGVMLTHEGRFGRQNIKPGASCVGQSFAPAQRRGASSVVQGAARQVRGFPNMSDAFDLRGGFVPHHVSASPSESSVSMCSSTRRRTTAGGIDVGTGR